MVFSAKLHSFEFAKVGPVGIEVVLTLDARLAEVEHVFVFDPMHPVHDRMTDLRLQFTDKAVERPHLGNGHEAQVFEHPALAGNDVEGVIEGVETSVRPGLPFKMVSSQFAPPCASWLGLRPW